MSCFSESERRLLALVLDRLVPADGGFPAAGALGVALHVEGVVAAAPDTRRLFLYGLALIDRAGPGEFSALTGAERDAVLRDVESSQPDFFRALLRHCYGGYYSHPEVIRRLGIEAEPPQPRGYHLDPFDVARLETVKRREPRYRLPPP